MREMECWEQHGFASFPRAVTHFYTLRYLLWMKELPVDQPYDIHHQYLWDIRMYEPVYQASDNPSLLKERLRSWDANPNHTCLSTRGYKLLGSERW